MSSFSSNAFANGANQNCGNFISERSTTRLHAPPGGSSTAGSLIFGGGSSNHTEVGVSSNRYANGANQNCGNVMTGRSSTRLHAPPGGSSSQAGSLIFGGGYTNPNQAKRRAQQQQQQVKQPMQPVTTHVQNVPVVNNTSVASKSQHITSTNNPMVAQQQPRQPVVRTSNNGVSSNKFATGSNQNCGNFITDRPTTRVHAPPGGKSSGPLW